MNRTYIESYYERYKDADFGADFIKKDMELGYKWLKSRPDREKIVEEIVKCRVKFVKYLKIIDLNAENRHDLPKMHAWQWIMIEYKAIVNYILTGNCEFSCFGEEIGLEIPVFEGFEDKNQYRELYLSSALTSHQRFESNAIIRLVE